MSLELEQAIEAAKHNDSQEAILKLCEVMSQIENQILYLQGASLENSDIKVRKSSIYKKAKRR